MLAHDIKLCVVLSHHYVNNVISHRFNRLKYYNPKATIYPIGLSGYKLIDGSGIIDRDLWPNNNKMCLPYEKKNRDWSLGDLCLYQAYLDNPDFDYYFLIEYDTAFNTPILDFFDITSLQYGGNCDNFDISQWIWYEIYKSQSFNINEFEVNEMGSTGATTCLWFTNDLLSLIVTECLTNTERYCNMFSELRLATLIKQYAHLNRSKPNIREFITVPGHEIVPSNYKHKRFFYHPCKDLLDAEL